MKSPILLKGWTVERFKKVDKHGRGLDNIEMHNIIDCLVDDGQEISDIKVAEEGLELILTDRDKRRFDVTKDE